jgi:predicted nucleotidyltransferase
VTDAITGALRRLAGLTAELGYPNAVIGGAAIIARSRRRATADIDVLMSWPSGELDRLLATATRHGYAFDPGARALAEAGLVRLWAPPGPPEGVGLDLILADSPYLGEVIARASEIELGGAKLAYATLEDLVLLKLEANRAIDIDDVLAIKDGLGPTLDMRFLSERATDLGLGSRLALYFGAD